MTRSVLYVGHPVAPNEAEIAEMAKADVFGAPAHGERARAQLDLAISRCALRANLERALRWLAWLRKSFPETTFIAPWISSIQAGGDDSDPAQREAGIVDCCAVVERCDGIVLVGGMISSGMRREMEHGSTFRESCKVLHHGFTIAFKVYDLTCPGNPEPPLTIQQDMSLEELNDIASKLWRKLWVG